MYIGLYLEKPIIEHGYYPKVDDNHIKKFNCGSLEQSLKLGQFFVDYINEECGTSVAPYEYDFWEISQCQKLVEWIQTNLNIIKENHLEDFFLVINNFCKKAIELDTCVEIDL